jgi:hypothetical protein
MLEMLPKEPARNSYHTTGYGDGDADDTLAESSFHSVK